MKEWLADYSLEWAAETCGISQKTIAALADRYANNGPAIIDFGLGGPDKYTNADVLGHSTSILVAITGNYGKPGAGFGFLSWRVGRRRSCRHVERLGPFPKSTHTTTCGISMYDMPYKENPFAWRLRSVMRSRCKLQRPTTPWLGLKAWTSSPSSISIILLRWIMPTSCCRLARNSSARRT